jgi:hypothetical protein
MHSPQRVHRRPVAALRMGFLPGLVALILVIGSSVASAQLCPPQPCPPRPCGSAVGGPMLGGYGNAGFGRGYSSWVSRSWGGGTCGVPVAQVCRTGWNGSGGWGGGWGNCWNPCWNPCATAWCPPVVSPGWCGPYVPFSGWSFGWPGWGWGWGGGFGTSWYASSGSVFLAGPGRGTFFSGFSGFSGGVVPIPYALPVVPFAGVPFTGVPFAAAARHGPRIGPGLSPAAITTAAMPSRPRADVLQAAALQSVSRSRPVSNTATRRRAATLMAAGDRHLATAAGDPQRLRSALDAYRRAASAAADEPDAFIREALVLVALGQDIAADRAIARAVAIDGRLAGDPSPAVRDAPADPVFGDRPFGEPSPLAARGRAILQDVVAAAAIQDASGGNADEAATHLARLATTWAGRWQDGGRAVAVVR